jgi:hypothetical protein
VEISGYELIKTTDTKDKHSVFCTWLLRESRDDYISPEKLLALQTEIEIVHEDPNKADIFSVGATLLHMLMLEVPKDVNKQEREPLSNNYLSDRTRFYCDAVRCLVYPMLRPTSDKRIPVASMRYYIQHLDIRDALDQTHDYELLEFHPELWKPHLVHDMNDLDLRNFDYPADSHIARL